jgi:ketosteroid isomerase-like protein
MSGENLEAVRAVFDAIGQRDLGALRGLTDPEVEWRSFFALGGGEYHGHDGLRQYLLDLDEAFEFLRPRVDDLLGIGETVVGVGGISYQGKGSGIEDDTPAGWVFSFRNGRLLRFRAFRDPEKALQVVGI